MKVYNSKKMICSHRYKKSLLSSLIFITTIFIRNVECTSIENSDETGEVIDLTMDTSPPPQSSKEKERSIVEIVYECLDSHLPEKLVTNVEKRKDLDDYDYPSEEEIGNCPSSGKKGKLWEANKLFAFDKEQDVTEIQVALCKRDVQCPIEEVKHFYWSPFPNQKLFDNSSVPYSNVSLINGGQLIVYDGGGKHHVYTKENYCISRLNNSRVSFKVCETNCSAERPCVRKCCKPSQIIGADSQACIHANPPWRPIFYKSANEQEKNAVNATLRVGFPTCKEKYFINPINALNHFKLLWNGSLVQIYGEIQTFINVDEFCIDGFVYGEKKGEESIRSGPIQYSNSEWDQVVIACRPTSNRAKIDAYRIPLLASLNCVSAFFLLLTLVAYILRWSHQNIHGWLQFSYVMSLFLTFICFVVVQKWSYELMQTSKYLCKVMGYITHLTYLSAFFWLTSMNFDLWWRFSRPLQNNSRMRPQKTKVIRFLGFAGFSIGVPLLISSIGITLDTVYDGRPLEPPVTVPGFGKDRCYFEENKTSQIPYLYAPAGILLLVDLIFFASTVFSLRKIHAHTELARNQSTLEDKTGLRVIAKLFIVMGVLWIFELAQWIAQVLLPPDKQMILLWIFLPIDILNCLQGVAIFFIFVCRPNVGNHLMSFIRRDDTGQTWNKQNQLPSVATVQQTIKPNEYEEIK